MTIHPKDSFFRKMSSGVLILLGLTITVLNVLTAHSLPTFLFGWPMVMLLIGLWVALGSRFRNPVGFVLIVLGATFSVLLDMPIPMGEIWLPSMLVGTGLFLIIRNRPRNNRTGCNVQ